MMRTSKGLLLIAGVLSLAVAVFQLIVTFSIPWSLYFGAPKEIVSNPPLLYVSGVIVTLFFVGFGLYAFSGAGAVRRMPFLRAGLISIAVLYTLRGLLLVPEVLTYHYNPRASELLPIQALWSSGVSLFVGIVYLMGVTIGRKSLPTKQRKSKLAA